MKKIILWTLLSLNINNSFCQTNCENIEKSITNRDFNSVKKSFISLLKNKGEDSCILTCMNLVINKIASGNKLDFYFYLLNLFYKKSDGYISEGLFTSLDTLIKSPNFKYFLENSYKLDTNKKTKFSSLLVDTNPFVNMDLQKRIKQIVLYLPKSKKGLRAYLINIISRIGNTK